MTLIGSSNMNNRSHEIDLEA